MEIGDLVMLESGEVHVEQIRNRIDMAAQDVAEYVGGPVLVIYYPDESSIDTEDVHILYRNLRDGSLSPDDPLPMLNIVLHTRGGDPNASYRLAQLVRDFANEITFIVPKYAYSGGTIITLAGDRILLAHCAVLSPIDVGLVYLYDDSNEAAENRLELVAMDHYLKMAADARIHVERALREAGIGDATSSVDNALMSAMVNNPEGAMRIGSYYRQRAIAETYANQLLKNYMLKEAPSHQLEQVLDGLITNAPDHDFDLDFHLCSDIGLVVDETDQRLSDLTQDLLQALEDGTSANVICPA